MEMRRVDLLAVRIPVGRSAEVEPHQDHDLPPSVLIRSLRKIDSPSAYVEEEVLTPIG
jgi:hypothetical protein